MISIKQKTERLLSTFPQITTATVLAAVVIVFSASTPHFLEASNLSNILESTSAISIAAFGMTLILLAGGIDLSVGSVVALIGVVAAKLLEEYSLGIGPVVLIALAIGAAVGLVNGLLITTWKVQPFLITLGTMTIIKGVALVVSGGKTTYVTNETFKRIFAKGDLLGIPVLILWTFAVLAVLFILVSRTIYGRHIQAIGGNEAAAQNSGVSVRRAKVIAYVVNGVLSSLCGLIILSKLSSGLPNAGQGLEMEAIAAAVLGGTGFKGEGGNMAGTLIGALVIGIVINGLTLLGVHSYIQTIVKGGIIIATVIGSIAFSGKEQ